MTIWLTATTRGARRRVVLLALDRPVDPELGVGLLAQRCRAARRQPAGNRFAFASRLAAVDAPLGDDDVVVPGVDKPDRAVVRPAAPSAASEFLAKFQIRCQPGPARRRRRDASSTSAGRQPVAPAFGEEVDRDARRGPAARQRSTT